MLNIARTALAVVAVASLAACDRSQTPAPPEAVAPATPLVAVAPEAPALPGGGLAIEGEGLRIFDETGAARAIPFGTPQATAIAAVSVATGFPAPPVTTNEECGAGPVQFAEFPNGLRLAFQENIFQGWLIDEPGLTTADGMGVGSTRASINARTVEMTAGSTLEGEFSSGEIGGFLSSPNPQGTVTSLYAGLTCFFR